ncbi:MULTISPECIES: DUF1772 domain-containing protein [Myxococcus]|uniref:anthrone oxygenase family protein n=1 Tax=Myxococcus TaxID=32 RepID=UPI001141BA72|nr:MULTISPECIES: anthrone oxygenase family protein [Myxococcus]MCK8498310.1 DUF1772 domain-containing protein [Myxococcus fulvus]
MLETLLPLLTWASLLGCGLMAGVFFAFSTFVMKGLARVPPATGIAAMQGINTAVMPSVFLGVFMATALVCAGLVVSSVFTWAQPAARLRLLGGLLYLVGCFGVTAGFNVPRNDALARLSADSAEAPAYWARYQSEWTAWNHVRTLACLGALVSLVLSRD